MTLPDDAESFRHVLDFWLSSLITYAENELSHDRHPQAVLEDVLRSLRRIVDA